METRDFVVRYDSEQRTVQGIAVPYNETIDIGFTKERFERGAFDSLDDVKLFYSHKEPIGRVTRGEETDEGLLIEAHISDTDRGNEVHTLLRDGVLNKFSIGFEPVENEKDGDVVVRRKVILREVSVVAFPAYENADVLAVREQSAETERVDMESTDNTQVDELREQLTDLDRRVTVISEAAPSGDVVPQFRSYGDYIKSVASGSEEGLEFASRAWSPAGASFDATPPDSIADSQWVSDIIRMVDLGRPTMNAFRVAALPADGMAVDYPKVKTNTINVAAQTAEGADLAFGKLTLETMSAAVKTLGGYTRISRQVIDRSSVAYVEAAFRAQGIEFAKASNADVIAVLEALTGVEEQEWDQTTAASLAAAFGNASVDIYEGAGLRPEFWLAATDQYVAMASLFDSVDRPIIGGQAPVNGIGSANIANLGASVFGLPVVVDPALTAGSLYIANREALVTYTNGGPLRLQQENAVNLSSDFSVFGYQAVTVPMEEAIVSVTAPANAGFSTKSAKK